MTNIIKGNIADVPGKKFFFGAVAIKDGRIERIQAISHEINKDAPFILPGFIDAHVHIESSMLVPSEFARLAAVHGTVATVSDPHEIANVCGMGGIDFMIENGKAVPFKFNFGAPSCVPATTFETAGAIVDVSNINDLLQREEIKYLSEMMNFPGVLNEDEDVMNKMAAARKCGKPIDGHAPGLQGEAAKKYISAGITTDHECFTLEEALEKIKYGMNIIIREGSAAKNFEALIPLLNDYPERIMFCSDDKHPDSLVEGHINQLCARAIAKGVDIFKVLQAACINPVLHYRLSVGLLKEGDEADFILVEDIQNFRVLQTFINGTLVADKGKSLIPRIAPSSTINNFHCTLKTPDDFAVHYRGEKEIPVIEALDGQLITNKLLKAPNVINNRIVSDTANDVLKLVVVNRYKDAPVATAFIKNIGLVKGALASSVAHDSHNIVAVGVDDESLCRAVNLVIEHKGGISCVGNGEMVLPLPVAGLMSSDDGYQVAEAYTRIDKAAKALGSKLSAPFMTLSFMALLVIPHIKLSDRGLFDGDQFRIME